MKRTQFKDAARNIRKQWVSWLSVIIIATLAVSAYLGIRFSADALRSSANGFYEDASFRDVEIISTLLFNEADLEALRGSEGVQEVVGLRSLDTSIIKGRSEQSVTIVSLSETVNRPSLTSGAFPEAPDQCLVESDIADALSLSVGDTIQVPSSDYLAQTSFTLTGIVTHPDHIATSEDVPGNRYVLVPMEAFSAEAFDNCYTSAEIIFEKPQDSDRFSKDYFDLITSYQASLEALGETQVLVRRQELVDRAQETIDENQEKLDEAETELQDARAELDETHELLEEKKPQLEDAALTLQEKKAELDAAKEELDDAKKELDAAAEELEEASQELENARTQLDNAAGELSSARTQLSQGYEQMLDEREKLQNYIDSQLKTMFPVNTPKIKWAKSRSYDIDSPNLTMRWVPITRSDSIDLTWNIKGQVKDILISYALDNGISKKEIKLYEPLIDSLMADYSTSKFEQQCEQWQVSHDAYIANRGQYYAGLREFDAKEAEYQAGVEEYEAGLEAYEAGEKDYKKAKKQYKKKKAEYEQAVEDLAAAETELEEKEAEYDDDVDSFKDASAELRQARRAVDQIPDNRWVHLGVKGNASYLFTRSLAENFSDISSTFSLLFVFIGALVIYATVSKIIEEQRKLVGTTKALGFRNREILGKYLSFGMSATLIGCIAGILIAYFVLERTMIRMQMNYFRIGAGTLVFETVPVAIVLGLGLVLSFLAVCLACRKLVRTPATQLLQGHVPSHRRRVKKKPSHGALYPRLILRNMRTDLKRVLVTIVSVAGSCALIVIGLTISHSMSSAIDIQFEQIYRYDYLLEYDKSLNSGAAVSVEEILDRAGAAYIQVSAHDQSFRNDDELDSTTLLVGDPAEIAEYTLFTDPRSGDVLSLSENGLYVPAKMEELGHCTDAGALTLYGETMEPYDVPVSGVFMSYIARFLVLSEDGYRAAFGKAPVYNEFLIRLDPAAAESIRAELEAVPGVQAFYHSNDRRSNFDSYISISRAIVALLTIMAFIMAYFILLNLINMYLNQKTRELTIMRVNGFTVREVKAYVGREMILTTVLGILLGLGAGSAIAYRIILLLENINCFDRSIYYVGWAAAAGITALFSLFISLLALRKVKHLSIRDLI